MTDRPKLVWPTLSAGVTSVEITRDHAREMQQVASATRNMISWTIYDHPLDYPTKFVARPFSLADGEVKPFIYCLTADTYEALLDMLPPGMARLPRSADDEPQIVEMWL